MLSLRGSRPDLVVMECIGHVTFTRVCCRGKRNDGGRQCDI